MTSTDTELYWDPFDTDLDDDAIADVRAGTFPGEAHTYRMLSGELPVFQSAVNEPSDR